MGFFSLYREQPVKHNQIPHAKQRGGRRQPHLLSGVASGKLTVREQLAAQMVEMERLWEKPLWLQLSPGRGGHLGLQAEKHPHPSWLGPTNRGWDHLERKGTEIYQASLVAQSAKSLPEMQETWGFEPWVRKIPLDKEMATHSSILAWRIPWREEPCRLQSMGSQRLGQNWEVNTHSIFLMWQMLNAQRSLIIKQLPKTDYFSRLEKWRLNR